MNLYSLLCIKSDFVPKEIINILLQNKSTDHSPALVGWGSNQSSTNHRQTKWLTLSSQIHTLLHKSIHEIHEEYLKPIYNTKLKNVEPPQFLRYDQTNHYDKHNDSESFVDGELQRVVNRDISLLLYLNDEYQGGEIEFTQLQITIKPKKGMLIAFPSYIEFEHKVHPVTSGTRYNIVSWIETEERIYERPYSTKYIQRTWVLSNQKLHS